MLMRLAQALACFERMSSPTNLKKMQNIRGDSHCCVNEMAFAAGQLTHADGSKDDEGPLLGPGACQSRENEA